MNILFVHQSFPSQYRHIIRALSLQSNHTLVGLGVNQPVEALPAGFSYFRYSLGRANTPGIHKWLLDMDSKLIRGEACAQAAVQLRDRGFVPDLICAHPGWGEALFLRDVWPSVPLLCYQEFFYQPNNSDSDFDPELQGILDWSSRSRLRLKNANPLLMLDASSWNVTPTYFQRSTFPKEFHPCISVIHDGIDTDLAAPSRVVESMLLADGTYLYPSDTIITFVNRHIEPYRGCHTFIRAIPELQLRHPKAHIVIVGSNSGVSYGQPAPNDSWKDVFLNEISSNYNPELVHFTGALPYSQFLDLLKLSSCHVYLTYPFVLSWSLLEAMSLSLPIVGSDTAPVREVIKNYDTGILVDFFSPSSLCDGVTEILDDSDLAFRLGRAARQFVVDHYSLDKCIPQQLSLLELVSSGSIG